jgi:DNA-binding transcriptional LysR family regulator
MSWDDLRYFLELARSARLTTAGRRLGVEHTTVARRVQALEAAAGQPLFFRASNGYELTDAGRKLLPTAEAMEQAYAGLGQTLPSDASRLSGLVRIGCSEAYGTMILPRHLAALSDRYPGITIDLLALPRAIHLPRQEADIVITSDPPEQGPYTIVKLADYDLRLYASPAYLAKHPTILTQDQLRSQVFVNYIEDLAVAKNLPFPTTLTEKPHCALRSTSSLAQRTAAEAGLGIAVLPSFLVGPDSCLRVVLGDTIRLQRTYWMTTPLGLRGVTRVRTTWDFLRQMAKTEVARLAGER